MEVQARGGLIENINRLTGRALLQFGREFHPLRLSTGEGCGRLSESHITQAHVDQGLQVAMDSANRLEELRGLFNGHVQHIGNRLALVVDLEGFPVVPRTVTDLTGHIDVGQKVHFNGDGSVPRAVLAASAFDIEAETALLITTNLGFLSLGKQRPDFVEDAGVGRRVGTRSPPDGGLVDVHNLVEQLNFFNPSMFARNVAGPIESVGESSVENVVHQRGFPGTAHSGHRGKHAQGNRDVDVFQVVFFCSTHSNDSLRVDGPWSPLLHHRKFAGEITSGDGVFGFGQGVHRPRVHDSTSVLPRARSDINKPVGCPDGFLVVFDHNQRVSQVSQGDQSVNQTPIVALVESDTGFIEDVEDTGEPRADLCGKPDALCFTPTEASGRS